MKENKYDDEKFFNQYSQMSRSVNGLKGAGEWHVLKKMLPDFKGKRVLDLGCGFGWHCQYAIEHGAEHALGIDISEKMLEEARKRNNSPRIEYKHMAIEDFDYSPESYDVVISSLTFHYLESFPDICMKVNSRSSIPCSQLTVVKTGITTHKAISSTGPWIGISRKGNGKPPSSVKT